MPFYSGTVVQWYGGIAHSSQCPFTAHVSFSVSLQVQHLRSQLGEPSGADRGQPVKRSHSPSPSPPKPRTGSNRFRLDMHAPLSCSSFGSSFCSCGSSYSSLVVFFSGSHSCIASTWNLHLPRVWSITRLVLTFMWLRFQAFSAYSASLMADPGFDS